MFLLEELGNHPKGSMNNLENSKLKKENDNSPVHLHNDFLFSSSKTGLMNSYKNIILKEQNERNKKIEIVLNARLKEQKNSERKTQMYFYDEYYSTNTSNIRSIVNIFMLD